MIPDLKKYCKSFPEKKFNPISKEIALSDHTPYTIFEKLQANEDYCFLLESQTPQKKLANYSFIALNPYLVFKCKGNKIEIKKKRNISCRTDDPLKILNILLKKNQEIIKNRSKYFWGGAIGYFSYESVRFFENKIVCTKPDLIKIPDIYLGFVNEVIVIDHFKKKVKIIITPIKKKSSLPAKEYLTACQRIEKIINLISLKNKTSEQPKGGGDPTKKTRPVYSNLSRKNFIQTVKIAKKHILNGDIYQINLSQQFTIPFPEDPLILYKNLREINPAPFGGLLKFKDFFLISSSPERLIKIKNQEIQTRPIAGTRPRGLTPSEDQHYKKDLLINDKERAEHLMLVDLARNDLGRICRYNSVKVDEFMILEPYSHVWHIVSNIHGKLKKNIGFIDILKACFPGGTITGCPKIKTMELINQIEPIQRSYYTGSFGYISFNGEIDFNILIRTILWKKGVAYMSTGAGIVADSNPLNEYRETLNKAQALFNAIEKASGSVLRFI